jgi:putative endonuclease
VNFGNAVWLKLGPETHAVAGERYERDAEALLKSHGLVLIERNWHCRFGEIDLIMRDGTTLVFVEVRQRNSQRFGGAALSIGRDKQARIERAAELYLSRLPSTPPCRIDAVLFDALKPPQWLRNIFAS